MVPCPPAAGRVHASRLDISSTCVFTSVSSSRFLIASTTKSRDSGRHAPRRAAQSPGSELAVVAQPCLARPRLTRPNSVEDWSCGSPRAAVAQTSTYMPRAPNPAPQLVANLQISAGLQWAAALLQPQLREHAQTARGQRRNTCARTARRAAGRSNPTALLICTARLPQAGTRWATSEPRLQDLGTPRPVTMRAACLDSPPRTLAPQHARQLAQLCARLPRPCASSPSSQL